MSIPFVSKLVFPVIVAGIVGGVTTTISLSSRVSAVEAHTQDQASHVERIEKHLDRIDNKLDQLLKLSGK